MFPVDMPLTVESTGEVSLANLKNLSYHSLPDISYLPASNNGDRAMKNISSELDMRGIAVVLLALFALTSTHVGVVEESD